jgi:hypothetical protein
MKWIIVILILALAIAGCTQKTDKAQYICQNGSTVYSPCNDPVACTPIWNCTNWTNCSTSGSQIRNCTDSKKCKTLVDIPAESQTCTPTVPGGVYAESDVDLAISAGRALQDAASWDDFYNSYTVFQGSDSYMIKTPYLMTVSYARTQAMKDGEISYATVRDLLGQNQLSVVILTTTDDYYTSNNTKNMSVMIKDLNKTYKATSVRAASEKLAGLYGTNYRTSINATGIPGFEDYAKKTVTLVIVTKSKNISYAIEMGKFK